MSEIVKFVRKSNDLVEARYKFDIWETRLFTKMLTMVHREDEEFKEYRVYLKDIIREFDLVRNKESYELLRAGARKLMKKTFLIPYETEGGQKRLFETPVIASLDSAASDGLRGSGEELHIQVSFHPKLKPYLLQLKSQFTMYDVRNILRLPSNYSVRIYELLKQYESIGRRRFQVQELKEILGVEALYPLYANFKQRVLAKAQTDLETHTDIRFLMEEIKRGRAVTELLFTILPNGETRRDVAAKPRFAKGKKMAEAPVPEEFSGQNQSGGVGETDDLFAEIFPKVKAYVREAVVRQWLRDLPGEQVQHGVNYVLEQLKKGAAIENPAGYLQTMVRQPVSQPSRKTGEPAFAKATAGERDERRQLERARTEQKSQLSARFGELQAERSAELQKIVLELFADDPALKLQLVDETRLDDDAHGAEAIALFDTYYSKAASFRAMVNSKVLLQRPEAFGALAKFEGEIQGLKVALSRL